MLLFLHTVLSMRPLLPSGVECDTLLCPQRLQRTFLTGGTTAGTTYDDYVSPYDTATTKGGGAYFRSELPFDQPRYPIRENPLVAAGARIDGGHVPPNMMPDSP